MPNAHRPMPDRWVQLNDDRTLTPTPTPTPTLTLTRWVQLNDERTEVMWGDLKVGGLLQP